MTRHEQKDQLDRLVRESLRKPLPEEARRVLGRDLNTVRLAWQRESRRPRLVLRWLSMHPTAVALGAACVLLVALTGTYLALRRGPAPDPLPASSYACAIAHSRVSSARCTAVFFSREQPNVWSERRTVILHPDGNMTTVIVYNQERTGS
jgi:hypothetical protein